MSVDKKFLAVMGLAMALPTTILGVGYAVYRLIKDGTISNEVGLIIILAVIFNFFFLMFRHLRKSDSKHNE